MDYGRTLRAVCDESSDSLEGEDLILFHKIFGYLDTEQKGCLSPELARRLIRLMGFESPRDAFDATELVDAKSLMRFITPLLYRSYSGETNTLMIWHMLSDSSQNSVSRSKFDAFCKSVQIPLSREHMDRFFNMHGTRDDDLNMSAGLEELKNIAALKTFLQKYGPIHETA